jgi:predicted AlkP superfamily phosphohydrolase/phosphomutase
VLWENSFPWQSIHSPRIGTLRLRRQDARTGSHRAHGFVLIAGPGIPAGGVLTGHSIYDIAPTVLHLSEVACPPDLDGRPLPLRHAAVAS